MITTTYECDRCHKTQTTDKQMWQVGIQCHCMELIDPHYSRTVRSQQLWCRACCDEYSLISERPMNAPAAMPEVTLEDKIRELIRSEMEARTS